MPLPEHQVKAILEALREKAPACPSCRHKKFNVPPELFFLMRFDPERKAVPGDGQPCVSAICENCGFVSLFNLFWLGIAPAFNLVPTSKQQEAEAPTR